MTRRTLTVLVVAVLAIGAVTVALALSVGGSDNGSTTHVMPNGQTMQGAGMHTMPNGSTMSNDKMHSGK